jgi:hypothetical protein
MKIYRHQESEKLFQLHQITDEQLIAMNDIHINYRKFLETIIGFSDKDLALHAPGNPTQVRYSLRNQINACMEFEKAYAEVLARSQG